MKYEKSDRIQREYYSSTIEFIKDAVNTLNDESNYNGVINIIASKHIVKRLIESIELIKLDDFQFETPNNNFSNDVDEYSITILRNGEVYCDPAKNKYSQYHDCDGFMFVHKNIDESVFRGNNRRCDAIVFDIEDL